MKRPPIKQSRSLQVTFRRDPDSGRYELDGEDAAWVGRVRDFLAALEARGLSANTISAYAYDIVVFSRWLTASRRGIDTIEQSDLLDFITEQRARGIGPSSINRRLTTVDALYRFVMGEPVPRRSAVSLPAPNRRGRGYDRLGVRLLGRSAQRALRVQVPQLLIEPLTTAQVKAFLMTFSRYRDLAIVYLMLLCGLRTCEVLAMEIDDIDAERSLVRVRGKGNKQRVVPLPRTVSKVMAAYIRLERPRNCLTNRLFVVSKGRGRGCPMTRDGLRSLFRGRRHRPLLKNANPHRLRHTFGTELARSGMSLPAIKKLMGHGDANTTLQYINLSLADIAEAFEQASDRIRKRYES